MPHRRDSNSDPEKEARAHRKELRTSWRTGATETEKITALRIALGQRKKKYSWLVEAEAITPEQVRAEKARIIGEQLEALSGNMPGEENSDANNDENGVINSPSDPEPVNIVAAASEDGNAPGKRKRLPDLGDKVNSNATPAKKRRKASSRKGKGKVAPVTTPLTPELTPGGDDDELITSHTAQGGTSAQAATVPDEDSGAEPHPQPTAERELSPFTADELFMME